MYSMLSRTADWFLSPLSWSLLLLLGAIALRKRQVATAGLTLAAIGLLAVFASEPVALALGRIVEAGADATIRPEEQYDAAIVLGGTVNPSVIIASPDSPEALGGRVQAALGLLRSGQTRHVLLSAGGNPADGPTEADAIAVALARHGIEEARIVRETHSRNTHENAMESARIVRQRGWSKLVLITDAAHMPRALACFRAEGLSPDAMPVNRRFARVATSFAPQAGNLATSADALHELFGRGIYWALGYSRR